MRWEVHWWVVVWGKVSGVGGRKKPVKKLFQVAHKASTIYPHMPILIKAKFYVSAK